MPLTRVTISGADDAVDVYALVDLTREFPFVEWGLLRSVNRGSEVVKSAKGARQPRYPSVTWREELANLLPDSASHLAAHLCGGMSRRALAGDGYVLSWDTVKYGRFQLNGASDYRLPGLMVSERRQDIEFILQAGYQEALHEHMTLIEREEYKNVSILYDPSGGRGIAPVSWPRRDKDARSVRLGYAGGLNPNNLSEVLAGFMEEPGDFWIDMESGVRTNDRFDLEKVRTVLERAKPFVGKAA